MGSSLLAIALTLTAGFFAVGALGMRRIGRLTDSRERRIDGPLVSVVLAARDEARHLGATLDTLRAQTYPSLEIVVVDDRSADATGAIADAAAAADPRIQVIHIPSLPAGWLGKNHALQAGAARTRGEYLLFTDADVRFSSGTIADAVRIVEAEALDHLAALPTITSPSPAVRWSIGAFAMFFVLFTRAWRVPDPSSSASIGIGAFNLVRTAAYRAVGGHEQIRLRPDDDLMLGRLLKHHGFKAGLRTSDGTVSVDWYASLGDLVRGVEKNTFAGLNYSGLAAIASVSGLVLHAGYFLVPFVVTGRLRILALADLAVVLAAGAVAAPTIGQSAWTTILQPVAALLFAWVHSRATLLTLVRGGIFWRGTFYPLSELRRNQPPHVGR
jgi:glycosyltransferase involved in cell wall biosynthesis